MAPRDFRHAVDDMLSEIKGIQRVTAGKGIEDYANDWLLKHAVQRAIEIISEASRAIPPDIQAFRPEIPWPRVAGIGNILRHEYHGLGRRRGRAAAVEGSALGNSFENMILKAPHGEGRRSRRLEPRGALEGAIGGRLVLRDGLRSPQDEATGRRNGAVAKPA